MTRYVIIGAGAVGVTFAAELARAGSDVLLVGRGRQLELLRSGQARYLRPQQSWTLDLPVAGGPDEVELQVGDILVLATKTQQAEEALATWAPRPVAGLPGTAGQVLPVVTLQNGLAAESAALRRFATVIGATVWCLSTYVEDGKVSVPTAPAPGVLWLGTHPDGPAPSCVVEIAADLTRAGFEVQVVDDLSRWKAAKLLLSVTFVLDALYEPGPERDRAAWLLTEEARAVLVGAGLEPADVATESTVHMERLGPASVPGHERLGSSTWQSMARSKDVESDHLNGEVVLLARQARRRAPVNEALQVRVQQAVRARTAPGSLSAADLAATLARTVLVDAATLRAELAGALVLALLDVRWALGDPDGEKHYRDGHLPAAVYVDLETELAAPASAAGGRHPLPELSDLQRAARGWGLRTGQPVVVYDNSGGLSAARAWWLLRWAGIDDVRILDGGLGAWVAAGGTLEIGDHRSVPGDVSLSAGHLPVLDADAAAALPARGLLVDARAGERYRGELEPIDPKAGHIPGAVSLPTVANLAPDGRYLPPAALRERFAAVGAGTRPVGVYCGSGVTAAHEIAALWVAGMSASLYAGSWSAWCADPARPVATGPDPAGTPTLGG
jgi:thiosulfate/3-mercaptopyruvate sulfurtransferase